MLNDKQFDALFGSPPPQDNPANMVAKAKRAASQTRKEKRKSPSSRRDDIFRTRGPPTPAGASSSKGSSLSKFFSNSAALCFATPIHDDSSPQTPSEEEVPLNLNGSEDNTTVTSTLYFDNKYSHVVENRPPMPLFDQFKVKSHHDELCRIVATDSHNSLKMIRLMEDIAEEPPINTAMLLEETEDEKEEPVLYKMKPKDDDDEYEEAPPPVKVKSDSSSSTDSSRSFERQREKLPTRRPKESPPS